MLDVVSFLPDRPFDEIGWLKTLVEHRARDGFETFIQRHGEGLLVSGGGRLALWETPDRTGALTLLAPAAADARFHCHVRGG